MCKGLIGKKMGMTSVFGPQGESIPVTVIKVGPCVVTQIKRESTDGYNALQLGFEEKKAARVNKPLTGHMQKSGKRLFAHLKEFPVDDPEQYKLGQEVPPEIFSVGERVDISGRTKGRGFSGVIKRHGFSGGRQTHGSHSKRIPGSVGCSATPSKIIRGKKMPGHYGFAKQTMRNLQIVDIRPDDGLILVKGAVPGFRTGLVEVKKLKFTK